MKLALGLNIPPENPFETLYRTPQFQVYSVSGKDLSVNVHVSWWCWEYVRNIREHFCLL
jgi:hypothetical protein